jgi:NIMA (never in mitosis gene a)-related kinase
MAQGLKCLHEKKILHRDLKCANVFITADGIYKLGDLNVSKVLKKDMAETQTGTPYYASPEVWKDKPYGPKSDMWSLGCVLYEMTALKPPFTAYDLQGLYKKVCIGVFDRIPLFYSNELASVIGLLLRIDPTKRPSA